MASAYFVMLIHELLNNDTYIVPEEAPLIVLDSKSSMRMANNGKYTKHTRQISRRMHWRSASGINWYQECKRS